MPTCPANLHTFMPSLSMPPRPSLRTVDIQFYPGEAMRITWRSAHRMEWENANADKDVAASQFDVSPLSLSSLPSRLPATPPPLLPSFPPSLLPSFLPSIHLALYLPLSISFDL
ncbi:hypothetical protein EmuJ_000913000 [Echinococcus multilocularis]|uniref:Uncharacterized protein n=1 Tax=Echinococcus multilocularis TaxID=6211 RepID=A0A068YGN8_ECHMU|nr:hypothetical protein EmuJ_000913000 [Echinococcus multilocularis]